MKYLLDGISEVLFVCGLVGVARWLKRQQKRHAMRQRVRHGRAKR